MKPETYMVRNRKPGWMNLAIGEPTCVQNAFGTLYPTLTQLGDTDLRYPDSGGHGALPVEVPLPRGLTMPENMVVITNGAKQAIAAALYAIKTCTPYRHVWAPRPYWPSFTTLTEAAGLEWSPDPISSIQILTWPNNPTGMDRGLLDRAEEARKLNVPSTQTVRIWDAAYASPIYGYWDQHETPPVHDIGVGSASKAFGLSGIRVGWLWTNNARFAAAAEEYVEATTSGVSTAAQNYLRAFLSRCHHFDREFSIAQTFAHTLIEHNEADFWRKLIQPGFIDAFHGSGSMFAWFKAKDPERFAAALEKAKVLLVPGMACGVDTEGFYRMNLAAHPVVIRNALTNIRRELNR